MRTKKKEPAAGAKALGRTSIKVAAHQLRGAPWNPRPEITSESVADLTASIKSLGLIQPLVVMKDPDKPSVKGTDFYLIVAGHRRYRACVDAGLSPIPCDLLEIDVETAKRMTFLENLQRRDADPLLESDLVASLLESGMTQAEIAAETGRGARWVARRANLRKLSPSWRKRVAKGERFTTDCLEHIAAYPEEMQERLKDVNCYRCTEEPFSWYDFRSYFDRESRDLKRAAFNVAQCLSCASNTGCLPDLFDQDGRKNAQLGRCLCEKCWREKCEAHIADTIAKAKKKGVEIVRKKPDSPWAATDRKTKEYTTLYVYKDGEETVAKWFKPTAEDEEAKKDLREAQKEAARKERLVARAFDVIREEIEKRVNDGDLMENDFVKLSKLRLQRELEDEAWLYSEDFVLDYVRVFGLDGIELDEEAAAELRKELEADTAKPDEQDADGDVPAGVMAEADDI